jgi:hypothetical protein
MPSTIVVARPWLRPLLLAAAALAGLPAAHTSAQVCSEDDGGPLSCEDEDAGSAGADAGTGTSAPRDGGTTGPAGGSGARFDAGAGAQAACSCTTNTIEGEYGRIHVCTGSTDPGACRRFECTLGELSHERACSERNVELCCVMRSRDLVSVLYEDCTHPNCRSGFIAQCMDFGGRVRDECEVLLDGNDRDGGGWCAVGAHADARGAWPIAFSLLGLALRGRRRRSAG